MPVLAKLSRRFYDVFGDDITNELVDWFNQVYANRHDLQGLNELDFQRLDAKPTVIPLATLMIALHLWSG